MARNANNSTGLSKQDPKGIIVKAPPAREYLCQHICRCATKTVLVDRLGRNLRQRCVSKGVDNDYKKGVQNVYLGEVGFDMTKLDCIRPLMSAKEPSRHSSFPLGAARREGICNFSKEEIEALGGAAFRIPDIIKIIVPGVPPVPSNIDKVIEIKFKGDNLGKKQKAAYLRIAGGRKKFIVIYERECKCKREEEKVKETAPSSLPAVVPQPKKEVRERFYPAAPENTAAPATHLSDYLIDNAKVVGQVVLVAGGIYLIVQTGGLLAPVLAGVMLGTAAAQ